MPNFQKRSQDTKTQGKIACSKEQNKSPEAVSEEIHRAYCQTKTKTTVLNMPKELKKNTRTEGNEMLLTELCPPIPIL